MGAAGARPGGGFWGHLKYYINRRDCVRAQLTFELQKITILHEKPPFWGAILTPKNANFDQKSSFSTRQPKLRFSTRMEVPSEIKKKLKNLKKYFFQKILNFSQFFQNRLARRATFDSSGSLDSLSPLSHFSAATITSKISFVSPDFFACSSLASPFNSTKRGPSKFWKKNNFLRPSPRRTLRSRTSQNSAATRLLATFAWYSNPIRTSSSH